MLSNTSPRAAELDIVVIGASAGAVDALSVLLPAIPAEATVPVVVVVHVPARSPSLLAPIFASKCAVVVREPVDKQSVEAGIWFAPSGYHLLVEGDRTFAFSVDEPVNFSRPSLDVLFESVALVYGARAAAFVLTGASADGAEGARAIRDAGGFVAVQEPSSAELQIMPRSAIDRADPHVVAPLPALAELLKELSTRGNGG